MSPLYGGTQLIRATEPTWVHLLTGLDSAEFEELLAALRPHAQEECPRAGRPWALPLEDRVLLYTVYRRSDLTVRDVATLFGVSKSAAERVVSHLGRLLVFSPVRHRRRRLVLSQQEFPIPTPLGAVDSAGPSTRQ